eukprot:TRINITY_DN32599_c0_g1_i1.p1 TRINITY_DN32599_c0_g1~~TRINITY_DN32599_c0_g1_i1.p1  ORF type:complete len:661 (+),score=116.01 TRINITY_DN32599_c0_g1_i1:40-2022(+)
MPPRMSVSFSNVEDEVAPSPERPSSPVTEPAAAAPSAPAPLPTLAVAPLLSPVVVEAPLQLSVDGGDEVNASQDSPGELSNRSSTGWNISSSTDPVGNFVEWAANRWRLIHGIFLDDHINQHALGGPETKVGGALAGRCVTDKLWAQQIRNLGYTGDPYAVFHDIAREVRHEGQEQQLQTAGVDHRRTISLAQFQRFENRVLAESRRLGAQEQGSPAARLRSLLWRQRNSLLRAWRLDLDTRGAGTVAYPDFAIACRRLGLQCQSRLVWNSLRPFDDRALEFSELCPEEAENLESFTEILWEVAGLDMDEAWRMIDLERKSKVNQADFVHACQGLGFEGNAVMLFRGLDTSGLGWIWREEFNYLAKVSKSARQRLYRAGVNGSLAALAHWAQRELGGAQELLQQLGLGPDRRYITVCDLAARLTALGFDGDARQAAARAARSEGGTQIAFETLRMLLTGEGKPRALVPESPKNRGLSSPASTLSKSSSSPSIGGKRTVVAKQPWKNNLEDASAKNAGKPRTSRNYFGDGPKLSWSKESPKFQPPSRRSSADSSATGADQSVMSELMLASKASTAARPQWNQSFSAKADFNVPKGMRTYFNDVAERPVRDAQRAALRQRASSAGHLGAGGDHSSRMSFAATETPGRLRSATEAPSHFAAVH